MINNINKPIYKIFLEGVIFLKNNKILALATQA
jgi:hypothetical protein